jgi:hypothetical protein
MVWAQDAFAGGEGGLKQRQGVGETVGVLVGAGEVVAAEEGVGVVEAQDPFASVGAGLEQGAGVGEPARR